MIQKMKTVNLRNYRVSSYDDYGDAVRTYSTKQIEVAISLVSHNTDTSSDITTEAENYIALTKSDYPRIGDTINDGTNTYTITGRTETHRYIILNLRKDDPVR